MIAAFAFKSQAHQALWVCMSLHSSLLSRMETWCLFGTASRCTQCPVHFHKAVHIRVMKASSCTRLPWLLRKTMGRQEQNNESLRSPFFPSPARPSHVLTAKTDFGLNQIFLFGRKPHFVSTPKQKPVLCLGVFPQAGASSLAPGNCSSTSARPNSTQANLQ